MIKLYDFPLSGHAHRVRLMLSLLGLDYELIHVDLPAGQHKRDEFLALNSFGQVPVLIDEDVVIRDSAAILVYLARRYGGSWYPEDPVSVARVQEWLATANKEIVAGPGAARLVTVFGAELDHRALVRQSHELLARINRHLEDREWLALSAPTVADVAAYSYLAHAPEGHVSLENYPHLRRWIARVEALPGFVPMQRTEVAGAA
jgi:glutathione S-transferase